MRKNLLVSLALCLFLLGPPSFENTANIYGQEKKEPRLCPDIPGETLGTHRFRRQGETIQISIRGDGISTSRGDCEPIALDLQWSNGRNNGSNFAITLRDGNNRPILSKSISGFMTGMAQLPLSSFNAQPVSGSPMGLISVPSTVTIQAVSPFAAPASISYRIVRVPRAPKGRNQEESEKSGPNESETSGNEIVSIHHTVRLVGASRVPLVQIQLRTNRPFPVSDVPLQLKIGNKIFVDELSGDYTGRKLTLSLTLEMYAELKDGEEVIAFFGGPNGDAGKRDVWRFGPLKNLQSF